jgi:hypothetical protein
MPRTSSSKSAANKNGIPTVAAQAQTPAAVSSSADLQNNTVNSTVTAYTNNNNKRTGGGGKKSSSTTSSTPKKQRVKKTEEIVVLSSDDDEDQPKTKVMKTDALSSSSSGLPHVPLLVSSSSSSSSAVPSNSPAKSSSPVKVLQLQQLPAATQTSCVVDNLPPGITKNLQVNLTKLSSEMTSNNFTKGVGGGPNRPPQIMLNPAGMFSGGGPEPPTTNDNKPTPENGI